ncbi:acyltransferase family protein, partial [Macellibacteroides fermentans]|uniref:acyltransferase family protein n=1 Tax=Macellibacteroides fermentans TaxID=879969 RepID=UPI002B3B7957|nr:acyltransferase [Macellibacteroides fermentans]
MSKIYASAAFADSKPHYNLLDGLRGVAALLVVWYHIFEGYAFAGGTLIESINHGYLAVDFFFILSGFVIGYAYDDRWGKSLTLKDFFKRRLIRLHPMVVMGAVLGAITFLIQGSVQWDGTHIATSMVMVALLLTMFFIPAIPGANYEVRGNGEMFPLNGPSWSLFFEYIGNILYALFIRKLSTKALMVLTVLLGIALTWFAMFDISGYGSIGVGWTLDSVNFLGGALRMLFPFTMGMLLSRHFKPIKVRGAFWICSAVLLVLFTV